MVVVDFPPSDVKFPIVETFSANPVKRMVVARIAYYLAKHSNSWGSLIDSQDLMVWSQQNPMGVAEYDNPLGVEKIDTEGFIDMLFHLGDRKDIEWKPHSFSFWTTARLQKKFAACLGNK